MNHRTTRREFLKQAAGAGVGLWAITRSARAQTKSPNEKLNIACIGVGGRGWDNVNGVSSENIVALCDVDENNLNKAAEKFTGATKYTDFRKMLEERKDIDAVTVSTPDHTHTVAAVMAMKMGKHVYCEKPLTHSVYEARMMAETAKRYKVATQMGNQAHSSESLRRAVDLIRSGVIGDVTEVHCWSDRPIWPQGIDRPSETPEVPPHLHWDLWLGPAPERPYHPAYHPFSWRGWWDFGTGALGDMGCHIIDTAYWALKLGQPVTVEAEGDPFKSETGPRWCIVRYEFPAREGMPPVKLTWYDGGRKPSADLVDGRSLESNGTIFVGDKGRVYYPHGGDYVLLPADQFKDFQKPERVLPISIGHYQEWIQACKGGTPALGNFEYSASLTEAVLLGNVAFRAQKKIEWDSRRMEAKNCPEAAPLVKPEFRKGWSL